MTDLTGVTTIVRENTARGEIALRRRGGVLELIVDGVFAMDTVDTSTEALLATEALAEHSAPRRVLIGGLGLGFTVRAALADDRISRVDVVERAEPLIRWARAALVPELADLEGPRCRLHEADVADVLGEATDGGTDPGSPRSPWDLILLDVDNGPDFLVHPDNAALYTPSGLAGVRRHLAPGGLATIWSSHRSASLLWALQSIAATHDHVDERVLEVQRQGRTLEYALYRLRRSAAASPP